MLPAVAVAGFMSSPRYATLRHPHAPLMRLVPTGASRGNDNGGDPAAVPRSTLWAEHGIQPTAGNGDGSCVRENQRRKRERLLTRRAAQGVARYACAAQRVKAPT
ncbi:hypothetical protein NDU88_007577 [Pleurodeles waltl]|uniref:Secreted protein n=1 Tax=Pleurodeles waltl TaxID=8319 RepID=A0AAV7RUH7_PLEWA|nr:hypothetical protein NDU88_007577 [Pleurodeles waltl]